MFFFLGGVLLFLIYFVWGGFCFLLKIHGAEDPGPPKPTRYPHARGAEIDTPETHVWVSADPGLGLEPWGPGTWGAARWPKRFTLLILLLAPLPLLFFSTLSLSSSFLSHCFKSLL